MKERTIAVIGAGAAGIGAARCLAEAGERVVVFEKSRGFGGRCATKRWEGQIIDHGAQYVTLRDPGFRERLQQACGSALCELVSPVVIESGEPLITDQRWYHAAGNSRLMGDLADGLDVRLGCAVDRVEPDGDGWLVGSERFDHIISTAPVPQTRELAGSLEQGARSGEFGVGSGEFGVGSGAYAPCLTGVLLFAGEGLGRTREVYAISDRSGHPLLWTACENHKAGRITPGNTALVVQASRGFSEQHLEGDPDVWSAELGELACERWDIPHDRLRKTSAHRWRLARVETPATTIELPPGWTYAGDGWGESRVESAWLAGWAAAEGLLQAG